MALDNIIEISLNKKNIKDIDIKNKRVLVRVDLNVPLDNRLDVRDTTKIDAVIPTIKYILDQNASVILVSHLGRPKGCAQYRMRLFPVVKLLERRLKQSVRYVSYTVGEEVDEALKTVQAKDVVLLENLRFNPEEEQNNEEFAKKLASYADVFVNDAFGTIHRAHASTSGVAKYIPAVSGLLVEKEIRYFSNIFRDPHRPFTVVLGGSKVSTKIGVIENLLNTVDSLIIGGGMCFTFFKAMGYEVGNSLCEDEKVATAKEILENAKAKGVEILLPEDIVVADEITNNAEKKVVSADAIPADMIGVDIGPASIGLFKTKLRASKTVLWNGPMGVFEIARFAKGTVAIAQAMAELDNAITLIGGGESVMAANIAEVRNMITHVSTGGGATLEFLEGKSLPGIIALNDKD